MLVDIEESLYKQVKIMVKSDDIEYPSIKFFVNQAVKEKLKRSGYM